MSNDVPCIKAGIPLLDAVSLLKSSGHMCLPIVDSNNKFLGILSPLNLLSHLLVLLTHKGKRIEDVADELQKRHDPEWDKKRRAAKAAGQMK